MLLKCKLDLIPQHRSESRPLTPYAGYLVPRDLPGSLSLPCFPFLTPTAASLQPLACGWAPTSTRHPTSCIASSRKPPTFPGWVKLLF